MTFEAALRALMTPVIIIGGITFGWLTSPEAATAARAWALLLGRMWFSTSFRILAIYFLLSDVARWPNEQPVGRWRFKRRRDN